MPRRFYLMRGLGGAMLSRGMDEIGACIRVAEPDAVVEVGDWSDMNKFIEDAFANKDAQIVFGGHSMGCKASFDAANILKTRGVSVSIVGLDPLCTNPRSDPGVGGVNIWGNMCFARTGEVPGANNIKHVGPSHIGYPSDPDVQKLFLDYALKQ